MHAGTDRPDAPSHQGPTRPRTEQDRSGAGLHSARRPPSGSDDRSSEGEPSRPAVLTVPASPGAKLRRRPRQDPGVEANARLTGVTAVVLLVLFAVEGLTVLRISTRPMLTAHIVVGMVLVPPVLLKLGSTLWRFVRYYTGNPAYRRRGAPPPLLRVLGPVLVLLTAVLLASGILLVLLNGQVRTTLLAVHKVSFVLWFVVLAVHVVGHLAETSRLAPRDFVARTRRRVRGASLRLWLVSTSLVAGVVLGAVIEPRIGPWLASGGIYPH